MNGRPSNIRVLGSSLIADPHAPQFKKYVYNGTDRIPPKPGPVPVADPEKCAADDCTGKKHAKDYCDLHYRRLMAFGTPYPPDRRTKEYRRASNGS